MDTWITTGALWVAEHPDVALYAVLAVLALVVWRRVAWERDYDRLGDDHTAAVLQLIDTGCVAFDDVSDDEGDRWEVERWRGTQHDWWPLTGEAAEEAAAMMRAGLVEHEPHSTGVRLTDEGRAELRLHRYPRPTTRERFGWWLRERSPLRRGTGRRDGLAEVA